MPMLMPMRFAFYGGIAILVLGGCQGGFDQKTSPIRVDARDEANFVTSMEAIMKPMSSAEREAFRANYLLLCQPTVIQLALDKRKEIGPDAPLPPISMAIIGSSLDGMTATEIHAAAEAARSASGRP